MSPKPTMIDPVLGPLTDDRLTGGYRILQRSKGHRFSADDVATAFVARNEAPGAARVLDLGCGIGSVLLLLAWNLPSASLVGVEAQAMSFELLGRNVTRNGLSDRVKVVHGDLRDTELDGTFELISGTPPYFPEDTALPAMDEQRAFARIERRGGVEAYIAAGSRWLSPEGALVLCGDARSGERVAKSALKNGLAVVARTDIVARAGKPPLFAIWTLRRAAAATVLSALTLRDAAGERTDDAARLRAFSGL